MDSVQNNRMNLGAAYKPRILTYNNPSVPNPTILVFSDTHFQAPRRYDQGNLWKTVISEINNTSHPIDLVVFNGDIADRGRLNARPQEVIPEIRKKLKRLLDTNEHIQVHVNLGNHDVLASLYDLLSDLRKEYPARFTTSDIYIVGQNAFIHGDLCCQFNKMPTHETMTVEEYSEKLESSDIVTTDTHFNKGMLDDLPEKDRRQMMQDWNRWPLKQLKELPPTAKGMFNAIETYLFAALEHDRDVDIGKEDIKSIFSGHHHSPYRVVGIKNGTIKHYLTGCSMKGLPNTVLKVDCSANDEGYNRVDPLFPGNTITTADLSDELIKAGKTASAVARWRGY